MDRARVLADWPPSTAQQELALGHAAFARQQYVGAIELYDQIELTAEEPSQIRPWLESERRFWRGLALERLEQGRGRAEMAQAVDSAPARSLRLWQEGWEGLRPDERALVAELLCDALQLDRRKLDEQLLAGVGIHREPGSEVTPAEALLASYGPQLVSQLFGKLTYAGIELAALAEDLAALPRESQAGCPGGSVLLERIAAAAGAESVLGECLDLVEVVMRCDAPTHEHAFENGAAL